MKTEIVAKAGGKLNANGGDRKGGQCNNITLKRGTKPSYITKRLARDAESNPLTALNGGLLCKILQPCT